MDIPGLRIFDHAKKKGIFDHAKNGIFYTKHLNLDSVTSGSLSADPIYWPRGGGVNWKGISL